MVQRPDYKPGHRFDCGITTSSALHRIQQGIPAEHAGGGNESDNGNGSLMRVLPVALVGRNLPVGELISRACMASRATHAHPRSQLVCAIYCVVIRELLNDV